MLVRSYWKDSYHPGESEWFDLAPDEFQLADAETLYDIATLVKDTSPPPSRDKQHAVYTLVMFPPSRTAGEIRNQAAVKGVDPIKGNRRNELNEACSASLVLYIGQTNDIVKRLYAHLNDRGAFITKVLNVSRIATIDWYNDEASARQAERETAERIRTLNEQVYVAGGR